MKGDEVRAEIPAWVGGTGQYAIIHVQYEPGTGEAWPVVQRVPGGWQSGAHHYPDDAVLDVRPLTLVDPGDTRSVVQRVAEHLLTHAIDMADCDADGNCACVCGWREGEGWDDHLADALADAGLLANDAAQAVVDAAVAWHRSGKTSDQVALLRAVKTYLAD